VIRYAYLWATESDEGLEEGRKDRPCAVVVALQMSNDATQVIVAPITSSSPKSKDCAILGPSRTRQRLGLHDADCWIVVTEVNRFAWPGPDLRPIEKDAGSAWTYGLLPADLFRQVRDSITARARGKRLRAVKRTE
jgi:hypothetical protein